MSDSPPPLVPSASAPTGPDKHPSKVFKAIDKAKRPRAERVVEWLTHPDERVQVRFFERVRTAERHLSSDELEAWNERWNSDGSRAWRHADEERAAMDRYLLESASSRKSECKWEAFQKDLSLFAHWMRHPDDRCNAS